MKGIEEIKKMTTMTNTYIVCVEYKAARHTNFRLVSEHDTLEAAVAEAMRHIAEYGHELDSIPTVSQKIAY
jgi:hypothetical protein